MSAGPLGRSNALFVLCIAFLIVAAMRAGTVVAQLPVAGDDGFGNPLPTVTAVDRTDAEEPSAGPKNAAPEALIAALKKRQDSLETREAEIASRELALRALEQRLTARLDEVETARKRLADTAVVVNEAAGNDVRHLAGMYQQMKPKQAAQIFNLMDPSFAAGFLSEMQNENAAHVLASMDPEKAYAVSVLLATRNFGNESVVSQ